VKLINTDGMALIGPGSEWFWTALSGIVLAITFIAIWRQLSMARSVRAREENISLFQDWESERQMRYRLEILLALRDGADRGHLPEGSAAGLLNWWEGVAELARNGDLDRKVLDSGWGVQYQAWWAILSPYVREKRAEQGNPGQYADNEWLAGYMADMDRRAGLPVVDEARLGPLDVLVTRLRDRLRIEEALRTVIVVSPEAASAGMPTTALAPEPPLA
jgi:hypothetical protein